MPRPSAPHGPTLAAPAWTWGLLLVLTFTQVWLGVSFVTSDGRMSPWLGWLFLVAGCVSAARAWRLGTLRVHLTAETVAIGGIPRRVIGWEDIRAIEVRRSFWLADRVVIVTESGDAITALVHGAWLDSEFERNHRLLAERWHSWTREAAVL
jgi:hypothetical protein